MAVLIGVVSFFVGLVAGGAGVYFFYTKKQNDTNNQNLENTLKNVLANHAKMHISESRTLIENIQQQCEALSLQMSQYETAINTPSEEESKVQLEYFSEQESTYLRHSKVGNRDKSHVNSSSQPRDYASNGSGLFVDQKTTDENTSEKQD